jgi:hypothetical protein
MGSQEDGSSPQRRLLLWACSFVVVLRIVSWPSVGLINAPSTPFFALLQTYSVFTIVFVAALVTVPLRVYWNSRNEKEEAGKLDDAETKDDTLSKSMQEDEQAENQAIQEGGLTPSLADRAADTEDTRVRAWVEALMMHDGNAKMKKLEGMKARRRRKTKDQALADATEQTETPQNDQRTIDELLEELGEIKTEKQEASGPKIVAKKKGKKQRLARPGSRDADGDDLSPRADAEHDGDGDGDGEGEGEGEGEGDDGDDGDADVEGEEKLGEVPEDPAEEAPVVPEAAAAEKSEASTPPEPLEKSPILEPTAPEAAESDTNSGWGSWDARSEDEAAPTVVQPGAALTSRERESSTEQPSEWQVSSRKGNAGRRRENASAAAAVAPNGRASTAGFDNLPAGDMVAWLNEHAPEQYLKDRLQQLCKEVKKMQSV